MHLKPVSWRNAWSTLKLSLFRSFLSFCSFSCWTFAKTNVSCAINCVYIELPSSARRLGWRHPSAKIYSRRSSQLYNRLRLINIPAVLRTSHTRVHGHGHPRWIQLEGEYPMYLRGCGRLLAANGVVGRTFSLLRLTFFLPSVVTEFTVAFCKDNHRDGYRYSYSIIRWNGVSLYVSKMKRAIKDRFDPIHRTYRSGHKRKRRGESWKL